MMKRFVMPLGLIALAWCLMGPLSAHAQSTDRMLDRTILPIPEPKPTPITEMDARKAKAPPRFEGSNRH